MLMTAEHLRKFVDTAETDEMLDEYLTALEAAVRQETHNTFTERGFRHVTAIQGGVMLTPSLRILTGDTVQIGEQLYTVLPDSMLSPAPADTDSAVLHRVAYPPDVVMGCVDILRYKLSKAGQNAADRAGIASETISRHSVTFSGEDAYSGILGVPERLARFLDRYRKARF
jgi:hypothetical protein